MFSVSGLRVLITGGGRGLGLGIASAFVGGGARVLLASRGAAPLARAAAALSASGPGSASSLAADVSSAEGCAALAAAAAEHFDGSLDVLVNNAGVAWGAPMAAFPAAQWSRVFDVNVRAPFLLTAALAPALRAGAATRGGGAARVINIGSVTGIVAQPFPTYPYDASKAALHALTRKLAAELAPAMTVNAIAPGYVPTRMSRGLSAYVSDDAVRRAIPMARWGEPEDVGAAALFLAARAGEWITGHVLVVDGGQSAQPLAMAQGAEPVEA